MHYRERLRVPAGWWVIGLFFAVSFATAVGFWVGPVASLVAGAAAAVLVAIALTWYGSVQIRVDERGLSAGDAVLEWAWLGDVTVHDEFATRSRLGRDADRLAYLVVRGYIRTSVEVAIADPADPHPYWLVSTRRPRELAAAIANQRSMMRR